MTLFEYDLSDIKRKKINHYESIKIVTCPLCKKDLESINDNLVRIERIYNNDQRVSELELLILI